MSIPSHEELSLLDQEPKIDREGRLFVHLAEEYLKAGDLERARSILEQGLAQRGESPKARLMLGQVLIASARKVWEEVLQQEPSNESALRSLAELEFSAGRRTEALKYYRALIRLDPGDNAVRARINSLSATDEKRAADPSLERLRRSVSPPGPPAAADPIFQQPFATEAVLAAPTAATTPSPVASRTDVVGLTDLLVRIIESRDAAARSESSLSRQLARAIGEELEVDEAQLEVLSLSALLANLGAHSATQFGIPARMEAGRRDPDVRITDELLGDIALPEGVLETLRHQHECWDGSGLPGGLREEEIPYTARVIAVARACAARLTGAFDGRPRTATEALTELQKEAGTRYDPVFVSVLRRAFRRRAEHGMGYGFGGRVLLVHPEEPRSVGLATQLQERGYLAEIVTETARARTSLRERPAVAILLGANLPRADLLRFIRDLRNSPALGGTPVLVVDANDLDLRVELLRVGADVCFAREADPRELKGTLDALLRRREVDPDETG